MWCRVLLHSNHMTNEQECTKYKDSSQMELVSVVRFVQHLPIQSHTLAGAALKLNHQILSIQSLYTNIEYTVQVDFGIWHTYMLFTQLNGAPAKLFKFYGIQLSFGRFNQLRCVYARVYVYVLSKCITNIFHDHNSKCSFHTTFYGIVAGVGGAVFPFWLDLTLTDTACCYKYILFQCRIKWRKKRKRNFFNWMRPRERQKFGERASENEKRASYWANDSKLELRQMVWTLKRFQALKW